MSDVWRIFVIAGDESLNQSLVNALRKDGYAVQGVTSGADAVRILWTEEHDVVICDLKTPGADGFELLQWLRAYRPSTRMIILGDANSSDVRMQLLESGADSYLERPIDVRLLKEELRRILQQTGFSASLDSFDLLDVIQIITMSRKSMTLLINTGLEEHGMLCFQTGELIWAEYGILRGEEAFFALAAHKNGTVIQQPWNNQTASNVTQPLSRLIFQALQYRTKYADRQQYSGEIARVPAQEPQGMAAPSFASAFSADDEIDDSPFVFADDAQGASAMQPVAPYQQPSAPLPTPPMAPQPSAPLYAQPAYPQQPSGAQPAYQQQPSGAQPAYPQQPSGAQLAYQQQPSGAQLAYQQQLSGAQPAYQQQPSGAQLAYQQQLSGAQLAAPVVQQSPAASAYPDAASRMPAYGTQQAAFEQQLAFEQQAAFLQQPAQEPELPPVKEWWESTAHFARVQAPDLQAQEELDDALAPTMALNSHELNALLRQISDPAAQQNPQAAPTQGASLPSWLTDQPTSGIPALRPSAPAGPASLDQPRMPQIPATPGPTEWVLPADYQAPKLNTDQLPPELPQAPAQQEPPAVSAWEQLTPLARSGPLRASRSDWNAEAQPEPPHMRTLSQPLRDYSAASARPTSDQTTLVPPVPAEYKEVDLSPSGALPAQGEGRRNYASLVAALQSLGYSVAGFIGAAVVSLSGQPIAQVAVNEIDFSRISTYLSNIQNMVLQAFGTEEWGEYEDTVITSGDRHILMRVVGSERRAFQVLITTRDANPQDCLEIMANVDSAISAALR